MASLDQVPIAKATSKLPHLNHKISPPTQGFEPESPSEIFSHKKKLKCNRTNHRKIWTWTKNNKNILWRTYHQGSLLEQISFQWKSDKWPSKSVQYDTGIIWSQWLPSTFELIRKQLNAKNSSDYRIVALVNRALKIIRNIKLEEGICDYQFGIEVGLGTAGVLFVVNVSIRRC